MGRQRSQARARKSPGKLFGAGIGAVVVGAGLLLAPAVMGNSPVASAFATGARLPAVFALLIGACLIAVHFVLRARARRQQQAAPRQEPNWTSWAPPETLAAIQRAIPQGGPISSFPDTDTAGDTGTAPLAAAPQRRRELAWSQNVFDDIEWRRFEAVCEQLFAQAGFEARTQSHGADGGVDIWLHSRHAQGPVAVVQCKHWSGKPVGVKEVREFLGVMTAHGLKRGTYATTSTFTSEAAKFAKENGVKSLDGAKLLAMIARRTPEKQLELLEVAYEGEYWRPTCAACGTKMVEREARKDASRFWGCAQFPRCRAILPMRAAA